MTRFSLCSPSQGFTGAKLRAEGVGSGYETRESLVEQTPGNGEGERSLACCSPRGRKELDTNN